jgi:hypothetical protein
MRQRLVLSVNKDSYECTVLVADWFALLSIIIQAKSYVWIATMVSMKRATQIFMSQKETFKTYKQKPIYSEEKRYLLNSTEL